MQKNIIADAAERSRALTLKESFIVQAPAGSGKTELLTQRFLLLLGTVNSPEEILAMTFTKKAAAEMRARIIHALQKASNTAKPELPHAQKTWELAQIVLQQDEKYNWQLLTCPSQLRIQTLDAFNNYLTSQLPISAKFGAVPELTENNNALYQLAVDQTLQQLEENHTVSDAIAILLSHRDNNLTNVAQLLVKLLARRDQWIDNINQNIQHPNLRKQLEQQLAIINLDILKNLSKNFPDEYQDEFIYLAKFAANCLLNEKSNSAIIACADLKKIPGHNLNERETWLAIAELLLTKSNEWRKRLDKNCGFPAEKKLASMKLRMTELLQQLIEHDDLRNNLIELRLAPEIFYSEQQWEILAALHEILKIAALKLKNIFSEQNQIDYTENALAALTVIDTNSNNKIKHILVDEFQDTSNAQYQLIKKITRDWQQNDGRTLFLVGDPMQSIYLFREAEVGLFIRTREKGLGHLTLTSLILSVNFRSTSGIIDWINFNFTKIFPKKDDIASAAVTYSSSQAAKISDNNLSNTEAVQIISQPALKNQWQGDEIVKLIKQRHSNNSNEKIAILVRSRSHLKDIIPALKQANLTYRAINIDPLSERPVIQDLLALTRALTNLADRIAWLAILRAPWCGLTLSDLLIIAEKKDITIWQQLQSAEIFKNLTIDGQLRLERILPILAETLADRERETIAKNIEQTWQLIGGPATILTINDLSDAKTYFKLLNKFNHPKKLFNLAELEYSVSQLFASSAVNANSNLQIMTIHSSKGLEFDTVILPHLEKSSARNDRSLLAWMERTDSENNNSAFIIAAMQASGAPADTVYEYIRRQNELRGEQEKNRLLYVAVTRTKKNLFLIFDQPKNQQPVPGSLLSKLWRSIEKDLIFTENSDDTEENIIKESSLIISQPIRRLASNWENFITLRSIKQINTNLDDKTGKYNILKSTDHTARHTGTIIHQIIQQLCQQGENWWLNKSNQIKQTWLTSSLMQLGLTKHKITEQLINNIFSAINLLLNDQRGRWIIAPQKFAQSEYRLTTLINNQPQQIIIDRTFVDENNIRWIIDFKTSNISANDPAEIENFLQQEQKKYHKQLKTYAAAIKNIDKREIKLGLYFPLLPAWCELTI